MKTVLRIAVGVVIGVIVLVLVWAHLPKSTQNAISAPKPPLPVELAFRNSLMGKGVVAQIKNTSAQSLPVVVVFTSPAFSEQKTYDVVLSPGAMQEIGHMQGWAMASGDTMELSSPGYEKKRVRLN